MQDVLQNKHLFTITLYNFSFAQYLCVLHMFYAYYSIVLFS